MNLILVSLNANSSDHQVNEKSLETGWYHSNSNGTGELRIFEYLNDSIYVDPTPIVTTSNFDRLKIWETVVAKGQYMLLIWLDKEGTKKWIDATELAVNNQTNLVFIFDNRILSTLMLPSKMTYGATAVSREDLSKEDLEEIKKRLQHSK